MTNALRDLEAALGVSYPASFHDRVNELLALATTPGFQRAFPATKLLLDADDVRAARTHVGGRLLPFMRSEAEHPDIYAFEQGRAAAEPKVVVWSVHTTVHEWSHFAQFLSWVRSEIERNQLTALGRI